MSSAQLVRPLHLHTVETLCADLVSGRAVGVGVTNSEFSLATACARSVLQWYTLNRPKWAGNVYDKDCEAIVDSIATQARVSPVVDFTGGVKARTLTLQSMRAHRFAGLHRYRKAAEAPEDFQLEFKSAVTFLDGANGAGKTSILNAIVWALTGQLLRPQRVPESGQTEFDCELAPVSSGEEAQTFRAVAVAPLPDLDIERPTGQGVVVGFPQFPGRFA
ncbi:ATP-binding protein [Hydrogenophaga sp.]|uniref:ATP-binding protein n=1 Tax=Hydrogenophaga sp. TaxID=1904254 RepID=UPI003AF83B43